LQPAFENASPAYARVPLLPSTTFPVANNWRQPPSVLSRVAIAACRRCADFSRCCRQWPQFKRAQWRWSANCRLSQIGARELTTRPESTSTTG